MSAQLSFLSARHLFASDVFLQLQNFWSKLWWRKECPYWQKILIWSSRLSSQISCFCQRPCYYDGADSHSPGLCYLLRSRLLRAMSLVNWTPKITQRFDMKLSCQIHKILKLTWIFQDGISKNSLQLGWQLQNANHFLFFFFFKLVQLFFGSLSFFPILCLFFHINTNIY